MGRDRRVGIGESGVRCGLKVHVRLGPALASSDGLELERGREVESEVESVPNGDVDGLHVEIVLEDNEASVDLSGIAEDLLEHRNGLVTSHLAASDLPV